MNQPSTSPAAATGIAADNSTIEHASTRSLVGVNTTGLTDEQLHKVVAFVLHQFGGPAVTDEFMRAAANAVPASYVVNAANPAGATNGAGGTVRLAAPNDNDRAIGHERRASRLVREGKLTEAEAEFRAAIRLDPDFADAHANLGVALARQGKVPEAEAAFRIAVALRPTSPSHYTNLSTACLDQRKPSESESAARAAVHLAPDNADAYRLLGSALEMQGRFDDAEAAYRKAVQIAPNHAELHYRVGTLLASRERFAEAEEAFRAAIAVDAKHAASWDSLCVLLERVERYADAEAAGREAVRLKPDSPDYQNNLGVAFAAQNRYADAEPCYREAIRLRPTSALALSNLGNALRNLDRLTEGEAVLREALRLRSNYPEAHNNLGITLVQAGKVREGIAAYDEAINMRADYPEARMNRSLALLSLGDYERGWPEYEWRWKLRNGPRPPEIAPRWDGTPLNGRILLLHAEQGLGDTAQFIRYAALVPRGSGGKVIVECPEPLVELAVTCPGVDQVITRGQTFPKVDVSTTLLSLPGLVGTNKVEAIPAPIPYFTPPADAVARWKEEFARIDGFKVGIAWQGSLQHKGDRIRSVKLLRFASFAAVPNVRLLSFQKGHGSEQLTDGSAGWLPITDIGSRLASNFADTAAALTALDLIVTIDTALGHVAAAIGREVWVLAPFAADWRWLREGDTTPWYPTMRLFRQPQPGDWDSVFARVAGELARRARSKTTQAETRSDISAPVA